MEEELPDLWKRIPPALMEEKLPDLATGRLTLRRKPIGPPSRIDKIQEGFHENNFNSLRVPRNSGKLLAFKKKSMQRNYWKIVC